MRAEHIKATGPCRKKSRFIVGIGLFTLFLFYYRNSLGVFNFKKIQTNVDTTGRKPLIIIMLCVYFDITYNQFLYTYSVALLHFHEFIFVAIHQ